ncbi:MAG: type II toxin-antitoxin system VapC family toxin [Actinomycetota bacterium]|nr:type II toxin-antitoxin system VapC family toxin [Actinomycetota bacterium]
MNFAPGLRALARATGEELLSKGDDFAKTDLAQV